MIDDNKAVNPLDNCVQTQRLGQHKMKHIYEMNKRINL